MKRLAAFILILALPASAAPFETDATFRLPATASGEALIEMDASFTLVGREAIVEAVAPQATWTRITWVLAPQQDGDIVDGTVDVTDPMYEEMGTFTNVRLEAASAGQGAVTVVDGHVRLNASDLVVIDTLPAGHAAELSAAVAPHPGTMPLPRASATSLMFEYTLQAPPVVHGDPTLTLFGFQGRLDHADGSVDLSSGVQERQATPGGGAVLVVVYDQLTMVASKAHVNGDELRGGGVATSLTSAVDGLLSFPMAVAGMADFGDENAAGTWELRGATRMEQVRPAPDGHASARIITESDGLVVDGRNPFVAEVALTSLGATLGTAAFLAVLWKTLPSITPFLTRLPLGKALENKNRKKLYEYILKAPGATFREVLRGTGIPAGTARHHLTVLARSEIIVEHGHRSTLRYFENHGKFDHAWESVVFLREPDLARVHEWVEANPDSIQKDLLAHAEGKWDWSRSTTQHRLARLVDAGLITYRQAGRRKFYRIAEAQPQRRPGIWS